MAEQYPNNNLEFGILNERIKAQIEIYEKFSQAFERTLEMLRTNGNKLNEIHVEFAQELRSSVKVLESLSNDLQNYSEYSKERWTAIQNQLQHNDEMILVGIRGLQEDKHLSTAIQNTLLEIKNELSDNFKDISNKLDLISSISQETKLQALDLSTKITILSQNELQHADAIKDMPGQIAGLVTARTNWGLKAKIIGAWFIAFSVLLGIIERLIQLGVLHITWGGTPK